MGLSRYLQLGFYLCPSTYTYIDIDIEIETNVDIDVDINIDIDSPTWRLMGLSSYFYLGF